MTYVVVDLEWNQAMSAKSSVFNHLPIHLRGEIIQIGAVRLNADFTPGDEFHCDVRPVWFRKMHHKVRKLTGFDNDRLAQGLSFPEAMERFSAWCGDDCTFMTWGYDDRGIMEQNLIIHDLEIDWLGEWINLQLIYNMQTDGDRNQKSLETAMEHFGIEQTRSAHDALGDAYNTAKVCSMLDMPSGLAHYGELCGKHVRSESIQDDSPTPISHTTTEPYYSREELWKAEDEAVLRCPDCGELIDRTKWINQGDHRYMALARCPKDGHFLMRTRLRHDEDGTWHANHLLYRADGSMVAYFQEKQKRPRRRRHRKQSSKS